MFSMYIQRIGENDKKETLSSSGVSPADKEMYLDRREGLMKQERVMYRLVMAW